SIAPSLISTDPDWASRKKTSPVAPVALSASRAASTVTSLVSRSLIRRRRPAGGTGERGVREPRVPRGPASRSKRSERRERRGGCGERAPPTPGQDPPADERCDMSERLTNDATVDVALDALKATSATGEVFLREAQSGSVEIKEGAIEAVIARGERGIGIRVLDEQRLGFAYTSDLSANGINACVDIARRMSGLTERDEDLALATRPIDDADLDIYQAGIVDRPLSE